MHNGRYPKAGDSSEWDEVLRLKAQMTDCQRYYCLPSQLDGEDYHLLELHRAIEAAEDQYQAAERRSRVNRARLQRRR